MRQRQRVAYVELNEQRVGMACLAWNSVLAGRVINSISTQFSRVKEVKLGESRLHNNQSIRATAGISFNVFQKS